MEENGRNKDKLQNLIAKTVDGAAQQVDRLTVFQEVLQITHTLSLPINMGRMKSYPTDSNQVHPL